MSVPNFTLLYVENPTRSAEFYSRLWERKPADSSPNFAMFVFEGGSKLGLWARTDVAPKPTAAPGASELIVYAKDRPEADALLQRWRDLGLPIAQEPTDMDFGYTFVGLDPDGHRLRALARPA